MVGFNLGLGSGVQLGWLGEGGGVVRAPPAPAVTAEPGSD